MSGRFGNCTTGERRGYPRVVRCLNPRQRTSIDCAPFGDLRPHQCHDLSWLACRSLFAVADNKYKVTDPMPVLVNPADPGEEGLQAVVLVLEYRDGVSLHWLLHDQSLPSGPISRSAISWFGSSSSGRSGLRRNLIPRNRADRGGRGLMPIVRIRSSNGFTPSPDFRRHTGTDPHATAPTAAGRSGRSRPTRPANRLSTI